MTLRTLSILAGAACTLLGLHLAVAWACTCPAIVPEARYFVVGTVTQIDGEGDHTAAERARWAGTLRLTPVAEGDPPPLRIWIRHEISDEQLRNVWIETAAPEPPPDDTGDTGVLCGRASGGGR
jgi:hypothetical protein